MVSLTVNDIVQLKHDSTVSHIFVAQESEEISMKTMQQSIS